MREIIAHKWCDPCYAETDGEKVKADDTVPLYIGGKARDLDMCADHKAKLVIPLAEALAKYGVNPSSQGTPQLHLTVNESQRWICPICPPSAGSILLKSAIHHIYSRHRLGEVYEMPTACPNCPYGHDGSKSARSIRMHRFYVHNYDTRAEIAQVIEGLI
jgi:hypothetical protein